MKIRSITLFCNPLIDDFESSLRRLSAFKDEIKESLQKKGWEIQTTRMATIPFGYFTDKQKGISQILKLEEQAEKFGFTYLAVGPARLSHPEDYERLPEILSKTRNVFVSGMLTHPHKGISVRAVQACAAVIAEAAAMTPDGFTNLRFCATSHVRPFTPFFPSSYSYGDGQAFAFAMECADAAVSAFTSAGNLSAGCEALLSTLQTAAGELEPVARRTGRRFGVDFKGFDFSLAPFPDEWCSIGAAIESLGAKQVGWMGSLASAAILMDTLDRGPWQRAGFNGLMLPILEDATLAARSLSGSLTVKDLLMISAVCGTGLDTVPLPGDTTAEQIEPLLMDIAALSLRLKKALTARLMPVPGLKSGDQTAFDFAFFKNGGVMGLPSEGMGTLLRDAEWVAVQSRQG